MYIPTEYIDTLQCHTCLFPRVNLLEGTVISLLEDNNGHIVGVHYKEKKTGSVKV